MSLPPEGDDVKIGFVVDVPLGADVVCATRRRVRVAIGAYEVTGPLLCTSQPGGGIR